VTCEPGRTLSAMRRCRAVVPAVLLALAACTGDGGGGDAAPRSGTTEAETPSGTRATPPSTEPLAGTASCTDDGADTAAFTPGADLLAVDLSATEGGLTVRFRLVGPVPTAGTTLWSVFARPPGGANVQFGARLEGDTRSPFVYHFGDRVQQDLPAEAMVVGTDVVEVAYPAAAVGSLRPPFDWRAESTVEVEDVDYCPGGADASILDDRRLPFAGGS
jgi:hypothetical protein